MEGTSQNKVVVRGQLAQAGLEFALVDQTAGFVDDDEGVHGPGENRLVWLSWLLGWTNIMKESEESGVDPDSVAGIVGV